MKLKEILEMKTEQEAGTYAGVTFAPTTITAFKNFIKKYKIPNATPIEKLHTTLLYSRKPLPNYKPETHINPPYVGTPENFEIWKTRDTESNCLILKYNCPGLIKRHNALMKEHEATFDFKDYIPHVTLSYNIGDMTLEDFGKPSELGDIIINKEYSTVLDPDWAKKL